MMTNHHSDALLHIRLGRKWSFIDFLSGKIFIAKIGERKEG
jgi:hypothetical protein